jgi:hypothetical protein
MTGRFRVDLLHPGDDLRQIGWVARSWEEWFVGPGAGRRLGLFAVGSLLVVAVVFVMAVLLPSWRLSSELSEVPRLRRDLATRQAELDLLRTSLGALSEEARRQLRWAELLTAVSQAIPSTLRLKAVESTRAPGAPQPGQKPGAKPQVEHVLRLDAVTPLRPGSPPLLEVAQFMAALMRDPAVNRRFQLKSWDIKSGADSLLSANIVLSERAQ